MSSGEKLVRGPVVLYEQMRVKILELIRERGLKPHDPMPSEVELAKLFGVSTRTSKEAMLHLVSEGIVYRMPRRGTFLARQPEGVESYTDSQAVQAGTKAVGIVVPVMDEYIGQVCAAAARELKRLGYESLFRFTDGSVHQEDQFIRELREESRLVGILLFPGNRRTCGDEVLRMHLDKFPIVVVDRLFRELNLSSVVHHHYQGAYELTEYLIRKGHRHIGFISEEITGIMSREDRYDGYAAAHVNLGVPVQSSSVLTSPGDGQRLQETDSRDILLRYLRDNPQMTAVFCSNDYVALQLMNAALEAGITIPGELSIVGYTDFQMASLLAVPLTTVRKQGEPLGLQAALLLHERIQHPEMPPRTLQLPTQLIERKSVRDLTH
ncbi:GntR family transcriptional regulator [Paenibacillus sp. GCM10023252]|uniref:GntR family transcriptional regulator n=1 Tax=Paenibacillus sp. GCM10023252 TaxID=3252649 RepID=UPI00361D8AFD